MAAAPARPPGATDTSSTGLASTGPNPAAAGRAGRNVPVAIGVGVSMGLAVLLPLYLDTPVFIGVLLLTIVAGIFEMARSLRVAGLVVPLPPLVSGGIVMIVLAYLRGPSALMVGLLLTLLALVGWPWHRGAVGPDRLRDLSGAVFAALYVPFLAGFCALLAASADGPQRVTTYIATVVCSDVGGFTVGVLAGRHPMAPSVSPKKSWEGFAGSVLACLLAGSIFLSMLLHVALWRGLVYGLAVAVAATVGDLGESVVKRDIGVKDMGRLLPGHGGVMDRLDSLLVTAPVAWLLLTALAPVR